MHDRSEDFEAGLAGAGAGLAATVAMTAVMLAAQRAGLLGEMPPHRIAAEGVERSPVRDDVGRRGRGVLGWLLHFGFGASTGALYALLRRRVGTPGPGAFHGAGFALAVWAVSYLGWVPALNFLPPATEDRPGRPPTMVAAHVVFGALLGTLVEREPAVRAGRSD
jgi:hypothetical protein